MSKHEALSLGPQHSLKQPGTMVQICNPSSLEVEAEDPWSSLAYKCS